MTSELEKQICIEYQNGLSAFEISNKYGFHVKTIRNKLTKNGFKLKKVRIIYLMNTILTLLIQKKKLIFWDI